MPTHRLARLVIVAILALVTLVSCGGDSSDGNDAEQDEVDAQSILERASDRMAETETMRFALEIEGDSWIDKDHTMRLIAARGQLARPDKVDVEFQVNVLGAQNVSIRMITVGGNSWTTDLLTGRWGPSPEEFGYDPSVLFDNQNGIGPVAGRLRDATVEGTETIGGRESWKITGTVDQETIAPVTSGVLEGEPVAIVLWVDTETDNILRIKVSEPDLGGTDAPATWTMTLTGQNGDVDIQAPDVDN